MLAELLCVLVCFRRTLFGHDIDTARGLPYKVLSDKRCLFVCHNCQGKHQSKNTHRCNVEYLHAELARKHPKTALSRRNLAVPKSLVEPIIKNSHVLMPNAAELELLTGEDDFRKGADFMIGMGVKIVAVKLGSKGCYVTDGQEHLNVEPFKVKALDTTGAGDAFNAGFLYGLIHEKSLYECGQLGNFVGSRNVLTMGARSGLPYAKDLAYLG